MNLNERIEREYESLRQDVHRPNILVAGATGTGKSSLNNLVFGAELAKTGVGRPVTRHLQRFDSPSVPLVLFDTVGYEVDLDSRTETVEEIIAFAAGRNEANAGERVHLVWYLIDASRSRILDIDIELCRRLREEKLPVAVVLSKCDLVTRAEIDAMRAALFEDMPGVDIFRVTTRLLPGTGHLDLEALCDWSAEQLPEGLQHAFVKAQRVSLRAKRRQALSITAQHAAVNIAAGVTPIPFSDAPILMLSQAGMIARILHVYEMGETLGALKSMYATVGGPMVSLLGIKTAASLLKFFPGVGTIAGGVINGAVAGVITTSIGLAVTGVCGHAYDLALTGREAELASYLGNLEGTFGSALGEAFARVKREGVDTLKKETMQ